MSGTGPPAGFHVKSALIGPLTGVGVGMVVVGTVVGTAVVGMAVVGIAVVGSAVVGTGVTAGRIVTWTVPERPPPGEGFFTETSAEPASCMSAAPIVADRAVPDSYVVTRS